MSVNITQDMIDNALSRPKDFAYFGGDPRMFKTVGMTGPTKNRDSDVLEISNYDVIYTDLKKRFPEYVYDIRVNHFLVGWVDIVCCQVIDNEGNPTKAFEALVEWQQKLDDYPIADEMHFSELEWNDFHETLENCYEPEPFTHPETCVSYEPIDYPEDWADQLADYLSDNCGISNSGDLRWSMVCDAHIELGFVKEVE